VNIDFTKEELALLLQLLNQVQARLDEAQILLELRRKIKDVKP